MPDVQCVKVNLVSGQVQSYQYHGLLSQTRYFLKPAFAGQPKRTKLEWAMITLELIFQNTDTSSKNNVYTSISKLRLKLKQT